MESTGKFSHLLYILTKTLSCSIFVGFTSSRASTNMSESRIQNEYIRPWDISKKANFAMPIRISCMVHNTLNPQLMILVLRPQ